MPRDAPRGPYLFKEVRSDPLQHLILPASLDLAQTERDLKIVSNRLPLPKVSPAIEEEEKGRAVPRGFRFQGESQQWREITFRSDLVVRLFRNLFHV